MTVAMPGSREFQTTPFIAPIKRFDETLRSAKGKLATPRAMDNTPDAQCIKLAADILRRRDASRRVMIVLTDGNGDYGHAVTKAAVQYAERAGVEMIGIGIERDVVSSYPTSIVVEDLSDLTGQAMTVLVNRLSAKRVA
jgi:nitric oxide reductase activation protein